MRVMDNSSLDSRDINLILETLRSHHSAVEAHRIITSAWGNVITYSRVWQIHTSLDRATGSGRPASQTRSNEIDAVKADIESDPRLSSYQLSERLGLSQTMVCNILRHDLGLINVNCKFVPHLITEEYKRQRD